MSSQLKFHSDLWIILQCVTQAEHSFNELSRLFLLHIALKKYANSILYLPLHARRNVYTNHSIPLVHLLLHLIWHIFEIFSDYQENFNCPLCLCENVCFLQSNLLSTKTNVNQVIFQTLSQTASYPAIWKIHVLRSQKPDSKLKSTRLRWVRHSSQNGGFP